MEHIYEVMLCCIAHIFCRDAVTKITDKVNENSYMRICNNILSKYSNDSSSSLSDFYVRTYNVMNQANINVPHFYRQLAKELLPEQVWRVVGVDDHKRTFRILNSALLKRAHEIAIRLCDEILVADEPTINDIIRDKFNDELLAVVKDTKRRLQRTIEDPNGLDASETNIKNEVRMSDIIADLRKENLHLRQEAKHLEGELAQVNKEVKRLEAELRKLKKEEKKEEQEKHKEEKKEHKEEQKQNEEKDIEPFEIQEGFKNYDELDLFSH